MRAIERKTKISNRSGALRHRSAIMWPSPVRAVLPAGNAAAPMSSATSRASTASAPGPSSAMRAQPSLFARWSKELASALEPVVEGKQGTEGQDGSTATLVAFLRRHRDRDARYDPSS